MVGVFSYRNKLLRDFAISCGPFCIYVCGVKFFRGAMWLVSGMMTKVAMASPDSFTIFK